MQDLSLAVRHIPAQTVRLASNGEGVYLVRLLFLL